MGTPLASLKERGPKMDQEKHWWVVLEQKSNRSGVPNDKLKEDVLRRVLDVQIEARN